MNGVLRYRSRRSARQGRTRSGKEEPERGEPGDAPMGRGGAPSSAERCRGVLRAWPRAVTPTTLCLFAAVSNVFHCRNKTWGPWGGHEALVNMYPKLDMDALERRMRVPREELGGVT